MAVGEGEAQQLAWQVKTVEEMKSSFDYAALGDDAKLSWDLFVYQMEAANRLVAARRSCSSWRSPRIVSAQPGASVADKRRSGTLGGAGLGPVAGPRVRGSRARESE